MNLDSKILWSINWQIACLFIIALDVLHSKCMRHCQGRSFWSQTQSKNSSNKGVVKCVTCGLTQRFTPLLLCVTWNLTQYCAFAYINLKLSKHQVVLHRSCRCCTGQKWTGDRHIGDNHCTRADVVRDESGGVVDTHRSQQLGCHSEGNRKLWLINLMI